MDMKTYRDISTSADTTAFNKRLVAFAHDLDFGIASGVLTERLPGRPLRWQCFGNTPEAWKSSCDAGVGRDPLFEALMRSNVPVIYDQDLYVSAGAADMWDHQAPFGYRTGVASTFRMPGGRHLLLGVDRVKRIPKNEKARIRFMAQVQLLAVYASEAAIALFTELEPEIECPLTARELECLKWTFEGKEAWDVSVILSLSKRTVEHHLDLAKRKLNSPNKHSASTKAFRLGWIK